MNFRNTFVLFGNRNTNFGTGSGERVTAGMALNEDGTIGVEASGFLLQ